MAAGTEPRITDYAGGRIHLIGIGGSSMSGLAEMLMDQGYQVSGSDRDEGYLIHHVREKGGKVMIGHRAENVHGADLVVYSAAIAKDNPERMEADRLGIPSMERAVLLGQLMEGYPRAVGICGAHGNGQERYDFLGDKVAVVQPLINSLITEYRDRMIAMEGGAGREAREAWLKNCGFIYDPSTAYNVIQAAVNKKLAGG